MDGEMLKTKTVGCEIIRESVSGVPAAPRDGVNAWYSGRNDLRELRYVKHF